MLAFRYCLLKLVTCGETLASVIIFYVLARDAFVGTKERIVALLP